MLFAVQGQSFFREGRYDQAAACFRTSLNKLEDARVRRQLHAADAYVTKGALRCLSSTWPGGRRLAREAELLPSLRAGEAEKLARGEKYDKVKPRKVDVQVRAQAGRHCAASSG